MDSDIFAVICLNDEFKWSGELIGRSDHGYEGLPANNSDNSIATNVILSSVNAKKVSEELNLLDRRGVSQDCCLHVQHYPGINRGVGATHHKVDRKCLHG